MKNILKAILIITLALVLISIPIMLGLTPLWVWIDNGHSIYGGINDSALSFGLAFIGTFIAMGGINPIAVVSVSASR